MELWRFEIGNLLNANDKVYKYMTINKFLHLVENNRTYFTIVESWDDSWEAPSRIIPAQLKDAKIEFLGYSICSDLFGQCWTLKEDSDAIWRIYSLNKDSIKIGTSIKKLELITGINHYVINKIHYYESLKDILQYLEMDVKGLSYLFADGLIKRNAFKHEQKVRVLILNDEKMVGKGMKDSNYMEFGINAIEFIEEIVIEPRAQDYHFQTIKNYCKRVGFDIIQVLI
ncbi:hypothetical protein FDA77_07020 [Clostridium botulinum]|uniref:hypothetical protein n=1 Tax=Clostridium botulinum TaxID=1491 RepID=UPI0013FB8846|nr:hypothetical protein [Clostridium botulinum]MBY6886491.1 hypothetical protein [Clostridium botulinum]NFI45022.1 hypothetical protein [Clostridium botulinum]NFJ89659.1 hypothetical protein [Clostridium botulinum]HBJ2608377.1 hypothetical protein [Clostridium botulinum]HDI3118715.1 hypothetical protein [Clostridium botulinum]